MDTVDLSSTWALLSPLEQTSVGDVYFRRRSVAETAARHRITVTEVSRALQSTYRRVAALVLEPDVAPTR